MVCSVVTKREVAESNSGFRKHVVESHLSCVPRGPHCLSTQECRAAVKVPKDEERVPSRGQVLERFLQGRESRRETREGGRGVRTQVGRAQIKARGARGKARIFSPRQFLQL